MVDLTESESRVRHLSGEGELEWTPWLGMQLRHVTKSPDVIKAEKRARDKQLLKDFVGILDKMEASIGYDAVKGSKREA